MFFQVEHELEALRNSLAENDSKKEELAKYEQVIAAHYKSR